MKVWLHLRFSFSWPSLSPASLKTVTFFAVQRSERQNGNVNKVLCIYVEISTWHLRFWFIVFVFPAAVSLSGQLFPTWIIWRLAELAGPHLHFYEQTTITFSFSLCCTSHEITFLFVWFLSGHCDQSLSVKGDKTRSKMWFVKHYFYLCDKPQETEIEIILFSTLFLATALVEPIAALINTTQSQTPDFLTVKHRWIPGENETEFNSKINK